jgi:MFS family permease
VQDKVRVSLQERSDQFLGLFRNSTDAALGKGPARNTAFVLALVLALDSADRSTLGVLAPSLKSAFHIGNTQIGMLAAAFSLVGGLATLPVGVLADRVRRVRLIGFAVVLWSMTMGVTAGSVSFAMLFVSRMALGIVTAAAGPPVSSLIGDLYPIDRRSQALSWVRSGELVGAGAGFLVSGLVVAVFSWRAVFVVLALAGVAVAWAVARRPEPRRGATETFGAEPTADHTLYQLLAAADVRPDPHGELHGDQRDRSLLWAIAYTLRIRTMVVVIIAGSLGDFFFSGLQVFAVVFAVHEFGISQAGAALLVPVAGAGAFFGLIGGGWLADSLIERGHISGRIEVGLWSFPLACVVIVPALFIHSVFLALPFLIVGSALLTAPNPALDAARLDVVHPELRGRAESVRSLCRVAAQATGPLAFGLLADHQAGGGVDGVRNAFLVTVPLLAANGLVLLAALHTYPSDVEAVARSTRDPEPSVQTQNGAG